MYRIPQLKLLGTSPMKAMSSHHSGQNQGSRVEGGTNGDGLVQQQTAPSSDMNHKQAVTGNDTAFLSAPSTHGLMREPMAVQSEGAPTSTNSGPVTASSDDAERNSAMAPFPNLETLSLAYNLVGKNPLPPSVVSLAVSVSCSSCWMKAWWLVPSGLC